MENLADLQIIDTETGEEVKVDDSPDYQDIAEEYIMNEFIKHGYVEYGEIDGKETCGVKAEYDKDYDSCVTKFMNILRYIDEIDKKCLWISNPKAGGKIRLRIPADLSGEEKDKYIEAAKYDFAKGVIEMKMVFEGKVPSVNGKLVVLPEFEEELISRAKAELENVIVSEE